MLCRWVLGILPSPTPHPAHPAGPQEAKPLSPFGSPFGSNDDRAPAWFEDFANGLLSAQKLTAALIVLHTGKDSAPWGLLQVGRPQGGRQDFGKP